MAPDALDLDTRRRLYQHVRKHPGKYLRELQRDLDLAMGSLEYHLDQLLKANLITAVHESQKRFFPAEMDRNDKRRLALLRQTFPRRILLLLLQSQPRTKHDFTDALDAPVSTLNHHIKHLVEEGLIEQRRHGRTNQYTLHDDEAIIRLLTVYRSSLLDRLVDAFLEGTDALRATPRTKQAEAPHATPGTKQAEAPDATSAAMQANAGRDPCDDARPKKDERDQTE